MTTPAQPIRDLGDQITDYRSLPSVSNLIEMFAANGASRSVRLPAIRSALERARSEIAAGRSTTIGALLGEVEHLVEVASAPWPKRAINATGVVLHTNLGRAVLSEAARQAMLEAASYSDLELDLASGERGRRDVHVERLLTALTGAEAATAVNNNAAALVLALSALARGREVIVSRGQAVEIGGRFRIPDVLRQSGAILREVGTTNRTYVSDYEDACTDQTALLLRVHHSNFQLSGFVAEVGVAELAGISRDRSISVLDDLGSGCLVDTARYGLRHEPTVQESVQAGADLIVFSGDKLLGGPQSGLIVGRKTLVERLRRHPLARALRCDKVTLAALHATLLHYVRGEAEEQVPTLRMLSRAQDDLASDAWRWRERLSLPGAEVVSSLSAVGGGSLPGSELSTAALALDPTAFGCSCAEMARRLRKADVPVIARVEKDRLWVDPRTVQPGEEDNLLTSIRQAAMGS